MIAVLVPTFGRADRLARVAANITENTETDHRVVFAVEACGVTLIVMTTGASPASRSA